MGILPALLLISLGLVVLALLLFFWGLRAGQLDDLETPPHRLLWEDEAPAPPEEDEAEGRSSGPAH